MLKNIVLPVFAVCLAVSLQAAKLTEGFEDKAALKKWEVQGDAVISQEQKHGGNSSLFVPNGATAVFKFSPENKFGTVTMWVYDSFVNKKGKGSGPYFGLMNSEEEKAVIILSFAPQVSPTVYSDIFTAETNWSSPWSSGIQRARKAWAKFTFTFTDDKTLGVTCNEDKEDTTFPTKLEFFNKGANSIILGGGPNLGAKNETFYFDDIEIDVKDAAKEEPKK